MIWPAESLVTDPTSEPIQLLDVKSALRIDSLALDERITVLIAAARQHVENVHGLAIMPQIWANYHAAFPCGPFWLTRWPVATSPAVTITYAKADGTTGTVDAATYSVDRLGKPSKVRLKYQQSWPTEVLETTNPIKVQFACGYANSESVPQDLKEALILIVERWLHNPSDIVLTQSGAAIGTPLPYASAAVLDHYSLRY